MTSRTLSSIVVLTIAAVASWYVARPDNTSDAEQFVSDKVHRGYYLKNARILGTGHDGSMLYEIAAEDAEQMEDKSIEFAKVRIRYSPEQNVPWVVRADEAILLADDALITLRGHVQITNSGVADEDTTEIRTQFLQLNPEKFLAETDERVQIRFGSRSVTATGMLASLHDDKIELKANVRGKIAP